MRRGAGQAFRGRLPGYPPRVPTPSDAPTRSLWGKGRERRLGGAPPGAGRLAARGGQVAGDLRIDAEVIKRTSSNGRDNVARVGAIRRGRAEISSLTSGDRADNQPDQHDETSDAHVYLRKTGRYCHQEVRPGADNFSTLPAPDTRAEGKGIDAYVAPGDSATFPASRNERRCIVAADGLGGKDRSTGGSGRCGLARYRRPAA